MRVKVLILLASLLGSGCELVSGLSDLDFDGQAGGGGSTTAATTSGGGGSGGAGSVGGGGAGTGGGASAPIDELFSNGDRRTCARRGDAYYCWGLTSGQSIGTPTLTTFLAGTTYVASGSENQCVISNGALYCWGTSNYSGELGLGDTDGHAVPQLVALPASVVAYGVGYSNACAVVATSPTTLRCWGSNSYGQIFFPVDDVAHPDPTEVTLPGTGPVVDVGLGNYMSCALRGTQVYCWGHNQDGTLGNGIDDSLDYPPGAIASAEPAAELAVYGDGGCLVSTTGPAYCWGYRFEGTGQVVPVSVLDGATGLCGGGTHVCGVRNGQVACAGGNDQFQLGYADVTIADNLVDIPGGAAQVVCGFMHTCALSVDGKVYCWGDNDGGALGYGSTVSLPEATPQSVTFPDP